MSPLTMKTCSFDSGLKFESCFFVQLRAYLNGRQGVDYFVEVIL